MKMRVTPRLTQSHSNIIQLPFREVAPTHLAMAQSILSHSSSAPAFLPLGDDRLLRRSLRERVRVAPHMLIVVSALVGSAVEAQAADLWTSGSGNLSTIGITNGSNLTFNNPGFTATVTNDAWVTALTGITFNAGAGTNTLMGSSVTIGAAGIVNNSVTTQTVALGLTQSANSSFNAANGNLVISGPLNNAGYSLTLGGAGNTAISGVISGSGALTKSGAGTVTLTGANSYTGGTTISAGTLRIGAGGSIQGSVTNAASLVFDPTGSSVILFSGNITNTSSNSIISVVSGTLQFGNGSVSNTITGYTAPAAASEVAGGNGGTALTLTNGANLFNNLISLITGGTGGAGGPGGGGAAGPMVTLAELAESG
jgi:autotransporter-associated beta strand protein